MLDYNVDAYVRKANKSICQTFYYVQNYVKDKILADFIFLQIQL